MVFVHFIFSFFDEFNVNLKRHEVENYVDLENVKNENLWIKITPPIFKAFSTFH